MNILLISKSFPPKNSARSLQIFKIFKTLTAAGHNVYVIAEKSNDLPIYPLVEYNNKVIYVPAKEKACNTLVSRVIRRLKKEINAINLASNWVKSSYSIFLKLSKSINFELLFSSSTPFESHLTALQITKNHKIPWVASFSDPWPVSILPYPYNLNSFLLFEPIQKNLIRKVLSKANAIHLTCDEAILPFESHLHINIREKSHFIPHIGTRLEVAENTLHLKGWLVHIGELTKERSSTNLLMGIKSAVKKLPNRFRGMIQIGDVCREFRSLVKYYRMEDIIQYRGKLTQNESMRLAYQSELLLVVEADMKYSPFLPSKFADYASTKRPIIAITPLHSPIRKYIDRYGGGLAIHDDKVAICNTIVNYFNSRNNNLHTFNGKINQLSDQFNPVKVGSDYEALFSNVI